MSKRITIVCDNNVGPLPGTLGEHGFAALLEEDGRTLLFDTGQGATLLHNARVMNRGLDRIDAVVLSHGHYDHTGGLLPLLQQGGGRHVYAHPGVFSPRFRVRENGEHVAIGIPWGKELLEESGARFDLGRDFRSLGGGVYLTGEVPRLVPFETGDSGLFCDPDGTVPDPLTDDQSLVIVSRHGLVLLLGCCHAGVVNTIELAREQTGIAEIYGIIGGTHLGFSTPQQLDDTVRALRKYKVRKILGSHCTGFAAAARLVREFPREFFPAQVGYTLEIQ
jgi:7,8-dihydropterin-6-yl-methyl-4-(beta-D-ribofuranosyl)aminobenzene 5'-phosphate synthase